MGVRGLKGEGGLVGLPFPWDGPGRETRAQGEGGDGTGARTGLQAPKERRLTRSLAAISLGRLPAGKVGRQGEGGEADVLGAPCLLLSTLQTIYLG